MHLNLTYSQIISYFILNFKPKCEYIFFKTGMFKHYSINNYYVLCRMASRVLLATLAVPLPSAHPEFDRFIETDKSPYEKAQKLAVLLSLPAPPTRISLLKEVVSLK